MRPSSQDLRAIHAKKWLNHNDDNDDDIIDFLPDTAPPPGSIKQYELGKRAFLETVESPSTTATSVSSNEGTVPPGRSRGGSLRRRARLWWGARAPKSWGPFWKRNRGVVLVAGAQLFGSLMNLTARLLELEGMHPFQILFARMLISAVIASGYMYKARVPDFPLGAREVRGLLIARGVTGFFGIYGMWYSMMYLPLAEATVMSFLAPCVSGYLCHVLLHDPFTRKEQIASFLALAGVIFIARPTSFFSGDDGGSVTTPPAAGVEVAASATNMTHGDTSGGSEGATQAQRLSAIGAALLGVLGSAGAFTSIRWIGKRAHPLLSVNYFSVWGTIVSTTVLASAPALDIGQPELRFGLPKSIYQWTLLAAVGICGMILQFMLTSGLGGEKSNRATAMVYTQMLFAAAFDKWVFGQEMGVLSLIGCGFIVGSALWVAVTKKETDANQQRPGDVEAVDVNTMEGEPMLRPDDAEDEDSDWSREEDGRQRQDILLAQVR